MAETADLELSLRRGTQGAYAVSMRLSQPGSDADTLVGEGPASFDLETLRAAAADPAAYGRSLSAALFADPRLREGFERARAAAQAVASPLRLRLLITPEAPELHTLFWETLRDPADTDATLLTGEGVLFSRYIPSRDLSPVVLRAKGELKALAAIANPSDLSEYGLAPLAADEELRRALTGLGDLPVTPLLADGKQHCTLEAILAGLRDGYDILYLVAHGIFLKEQPWLVLEGADGKVQRVSGQELAASIREMQAKPRLIVLVSCESAGKGTGAAMQALGPRLAEAGVPAVIAMQGSISMDTVEKFMPVFFKELRRDGCLDRAVSVARGAVKGEDDFWMPVLFMRLKSGRIWPEESPQLAGNYSVHMGDTYNVSNIQNSNLNLGSTLTNVTFSAGNISGFDQGFKEYLARLIEQLNLALQKASGENEEAAQAVAALTVELVEALAKENVNTERIKILLGGLGQAAEIAGKGLPEVPPIVSRIASRVSDVMKIS